jgi:hypothetical protein
MCTLNIRNHQVQQKFVPSLQFVHFLQGIAAANSDKLNLRSTNVPASTALGSLMIASGILLLLSAVSLLAGAVKVCGFFTLFHIW